MLPLSTLLQLMTADQAFDRLIAILVRLGVPVDKWTKGGTFRVIVRAVAILYAMFTVILAAFAGGAFLETATDDWLSLLARNVYNVERRLATRAREKITLTNASANLFEDNLPGSVIVFNEKTKKTYQNIETFTLGPSTTIDVMFEAVEPGAASTSPAGTITGLETHLAGVTVTNKKAFIGLDDESDIDLRAACWARLGSLSVRGPRGAYQWAIRQAVLEDGVTPVNINRSQISTSDSKGRVFVWLATPAGAPTEEDVAACAESIEQNARPNAVRVYTAACTEVDIERTIELWVRLRPGAAANDIKAAVETAYVRQGATYPIGGIAKQRGAKGKVWADWLAGVAKEAWPDTFDVDGTGEDQELEQGQVGRFAIRVNVHLVEAA